MRQRWAKYYDCSLDVAQPVSEAYFVALFSALPVKSLECKPFANSGMGRELVWMQVETAPNQTLFVGTSHLESLPQFKQTRVMQLKESLTTLQERVDEVNKESSGTTRCLGAVFMGDMNLIRGDMKLLDPSIVDGDIVVELAKTSRSKCRRCAETIEKDTLRVGRNAKDKLPNGRTVDICHWYHSKCFEGISTSTEKQILYGSSLWTGKKPAQDASSSTTSAASPDPVCAQYGRQYTCMILLALTALLWCNCTGIYGLASRLEGSVAHSRWQHRREWVHFRWTQQWTGEQPILSQSTGSNVLLLWRSIERQ